MEENNNNDNAIDIGSVRVSEEVIAIIAGIAATEVAGVAGMSGGIAGGIAGILGRKNLSKGVKVEVGEKEAIINLYIIVELGYRIPDVAWEIQEKVKKSVEMMTGLDVIEVNIHIQGISKAEQKNNAGDSSHDVPKTPSESGDTYKEVDR
ncbi:MAG: Asp23/Gls24 family envelope stress response protein [Eubacteriales bacterium]|nr:Asp23/Gls24 family envelope stress response protein [Eubacteriales bacterium]